MSRIGIKPITIPAGVEVTVEDGNVVKVKGPKGELSAKVGNGMKVKIEDGTLNVERVNDARENRSQHGLARTLIDNMVTGVTNGFEKKLQIVGVGYSAAKQGNKLVLKLGYSHRHLQKAYKKPKPRSVMLRAVRLILRNNRACSRGIWGSRSHAPGRRWGIFSGACRPC